MEKRRESRRHNSPSAFEMSLPFVCNSVVVEGVGVLGVESDGLVVEVFDCLIASALLGIGEATEIKSQGVDRFESDGFAEVLDRLVESALVGICRAPVSIDEFSAQRKEGTKKLTCRYRWFTDAPLRDGKHALHVNWIGVTISTAKEKVTFRRTDNQERALLLARRRKKLWGERRGVPMKVPHEPS